MQSCIKFKSMVPEIQMKIEKSLHTYIHTDQPSQQQHQPSHRISISLLITNQSAKKD